MFLLSAQAPPVGGPGYQFPMVAIAPQPRAPYNAPHDFLILAMVTTIICAILNLLSLVFGIPAVVLSGMVSPQSWNLKINVFTQVQGFIRITCDSIMSAHNIYNCIYLPP